MVTFWAHRHRLPKDPRPVEIALRLGKSYSGSGVKGLSLPGLLQPNATDQPLAVICPRLRFSQSARFSAMTGLPRARPGYGAGSFICRALAALVISSIHLWKPQSRSHRRGLRHRRPCTRAGQIAWPRAWSNSLSLASCRTKCRLRTIGRPIVSIAGEHPHIASLKHTIEW